MRTSLTWAVTVFGLLWLGIPVVGLAYTEPAAWEIALAAVGVLAFASWFLILVMTQVRPHVPIVGMVAVAVVLTLAVFDGFALMFVYAASAASVRLAGRTSALTVAAITAVGAAALALTDPEGAVFWGITGTILAAGTLWFLIGGLLRSNAALREARADLAELAVAEERLRFARDMHDLLGHDLSLMAIKAELAGKLLPENPGRAAAEVADIRGLSRTALIQVRQAVDGYRRPTLPSELAGARAALEAAAIELRIDAPGEIDDPEVEAVLAWAVREAATNVIRHSGARRAAITITDTGVEIADDGRGAPAPAGHGLAGLRERAEALGGTLEAGAAPGGGFRLRVSVPAREGANAA